MITLALDTSSRTLSLAIIKEDALIAEKQIASKGMLSAYIITEIDALLKANSLEQSDINAIAVGLGPGYFTSLRVGLSTVKGLTFASEIGVVGVCSLDVIAQGTKTKAKELAVVVDAKRNLIYGAHYSNIDGKLSRESDYVLQSIEDFLADKSGAIAFVGDGVSLYKEQIEKATNIEAEFVSEDYWLPKAQYVYECAKERIVNKDFDDCKKLLPIYLYPEDCQVSK